MAKNKKSKAQAGNRHPVRKEGGLHAGSSKTMAKHGNSVQKKGKGGAKGRGKAPSSDHPSRRKPAPGPQVKVTSTGNFSSRNKGKGKIAHMRQLRSSTTTSSRNQLALYEQAGGVVQRVFVEKKSGLKNALYNSRPKPGSTSFLSGTTTSASNKVTVKSGEVRCSTTATDEEADPEDPASSALPALCAIVSKTLKLAPLLLPLLQQNHAAVLDQIAEVSAEQEQRRGGSSSTSSGRCNSTTAAQPKHLGFVLVMVTQLLYCREQGKSFKVGGRKVTPLKRIVEEVRNGLIASTCSSGKTKMNKNEANVDAPLLAEHRRSKHGCENEKMNAPGTHGDERRNTISEKQLQAILLDHNSPSHDGADHKNTTVSGERPEEDGAGKQYCYFRINPRIVLPLAVQASHERPAEAVEVEGRQVEEREQNANKSPGGRGKEVQELVVEPQARNCTPSSKTSTPLQPPSTNCFTSENINILTEIDKWLDPVTQSFLHEKMESLKKQGNKPTKKKIVENTSEVDAGSTTSTTSSCGASTSSTAAALARVFEKDSVVPLCYRMEKRNYATYLHPLADAGIVIVQDRSSQFSALAAVDTLLGGGGNNSTLPKEVDDDHVDDRNDGAAVPCRRRRGSSSSFSSSFSSGLKILDACSAPGSKTSHVIHLLQLYRAYHHDKRMLVSPGRSCASGSSSIRSKKRADEVEQTETPTPIMDTVIALERDPKRFRILLTRLATVCDLFAVDEGQELLRPGGEKSCSPLQPAEIGEKYKDFFATAKKSSVLSSQNRIITDYGQEKVDKLTDHGIKNPPAENKRKDHTATSWAGSDPMELKFHIPIPQRGAPEQDKDLTKAKHSILVVLKLGDFLQLRRNEETAQRGPAERNSTFLSHDDHLDAILLDPSCSGSGLQEHNQEKNRYEITKNTSDRMKMLSKNNSTSTLEEVLPEQDQFSALDPSARARVESLAEFQTRMLQHALGLIAGGASLKCLHDRSSQVNKNVKRSRPSYVFYSTCSVYDRENERVVIDGVERAEREVVVETEQLQIMQRGREGEALVGSLFPPAQVVELHLLQQQNLFEVQAALPASMRAVWKEETSLRKVKAHFSGSGGALNNRLDCSTDEMNGGENENDVAMKELSEEGDPLHLHEVDAVDKDHDQGGRRRGEESPRLPRPADADPQLASNVNHLRMLCAHSYPEEHQCRGFFLAKVALSSVDPCRAARGGSEPKDGTSTTQPQADEVMKNDYRDHTETDQHGRKTASSSPSSRHEPVEQVETHQAGRREAASKKRQTASGNVGISSTEEDFAPQQTSQYVSVKKARRLMAELRSQLHACKK
ncbi:unnamed protein product [Amoebophrya sp. A120]|nr:unnamed protein product [Amoebophrya sp. A120]|eukprot:GSA120T00024345001.1